MKLPSNNILSAASPFKKIFLKHKKIIIMKTLKFIPVLLLFVITSCSSVRVYADYDTKATFTNYKTYSYLKSGIDKAEISDLDKKRIRSLRDINQKNIIIFLNPFFLPYCYLSKF